MSEFVGALDQIKGYSAYHLAERAACGAPGHKESAGALLLRSLRDEFVEMVEPNPEIMPDDVREAGVDQFTEGMVSIDEYEKWRQFVDLSAWREKPKSGQWPTDLDAAATTALYQILDRLTYALIGEWEELKREETQARLMARPDILEMVQRGREEPVTGARPVRRPKATESPE